MLTQNWQPPAQPAPARLPVFRSGGGKFLLAFGAVAVAGIIGLAALGSSGTSDTPAKADDSFYVQAGWSVSRIADLSVKMQRDDGVSKVRAQCAMKNIAAAMTWLEWQATGTGGRFSLIRAAESGC